MDDLVQAFALPHLGVRGAWVGLKRAYREVLSHQPYPGPVKAWLGEALAATCLLTTGIKFQGRLSLQLQGSGALKLLYAECSSDGDLRGIARHETEASSGQWLVALAGSSVLAITLEPYQGRERYQGVVALEGETLGETLEGYFAQSEQLPTRLLLAADGQDAAGLLLQRIPASGGNTEVDPDGWNLAQHLLATVGEAELLETDRERMLHRLFHDQDLLLSDPLPIHLRCRCSRGKVAEVLRRIGHDEAIAATNDLGHAEITCEFCGKVYRFDPIEVEQLFHDQPPEPGTDRRH